MIWWAPTSGFIGGHLFTVTSHGRKDTNKASGISFYKGTNLIHEGSIPQDLIISQSTTFKQHQRFEVKISVYDFGGQKHPCL